jgi:tetratricopeptide (TPR) repeat protein
MLSAEVVYLFRHAIMRDAAYQLQPPADRSRLHALALHIVEHLHGGPPPEQDNDEAHPLDKQAEELAFHARIGREHDAALVQRYRQYLWRAARYAHRSYRTHAATELTQALEQDCPEGSALKAAAAFLLGHSLLSAGRMAEAEGPLRRAAEGASAGSQYAARASIHLVHLYSRQGRLAEARILGAQIAQLLDALPASMQVSTLTTNAALARALGDTRGSEQDVRRALAIAVEHKLVLGASEARGHLASLAAAEGRTQEAEVELREGIRLAAQAGDARVETVHTSNLATLLRSVDRTEEAAEAYDRALALARRVGDRFMEATILGNRANLLGDDRLDEAEAAYRHALDVSIECGDARKQAHWLGRIAVVEYNRGNYPQAERQYLAAIEVARASGDLLQEGVWLAGLCLARIYIGSQTAAEEAWRKAESLLASRDPQRLQTCRQDVREACAEAGVDPALFASA